MTQTVSEADLELASRDDDFRQKQLVRDIMGVAMIVPTFLFIGITALGFLRPPPGISLAISFPVWLTICTAYLILATGLGMFFYRKLAQSRSVQESNQQGLLLLLATMAVTEAICIQALIGHMIVQATPGQLLGLQVVGSVVVIANFVIVRPLIRREVLRQMVLSKTGRS